MREHRDSLPKGAGPAGQPSHPFTVGMLAPRHLSRAVMTVSHAQQAASRDRDGKIFSKRSRPPTDWLPNNADKEALLNWINSGPDKWALLEARDGDWGSLALYLEAGQPVTPDIRKFLSEVLRGDRKRPNNRPLWPTQ